MNVIELANVGKVFDDRGGRTEALKDINVQIAKGEFVAIMGNSGSGKSTLMNIIGLLDVPTSGQYLLDGAAVESKSDAQLAHLRRDKIGFVFQSFNLLNRLTLLQNVEIPMIYGGIGVRERRKIAMELLDLVGIADQAKHRPNEVSGGQAQRAAIARALTNNPSLILADEPTGNLDTKSSTAIMDTLHNLHRAGTTIVMVTHNPDLGQQADRTIVVRDGEIVDSSPSVKPASAARVKRRVRL